MTYNYLNLRASLCFVLFIFSIALCSQETLHSEYEEIRLKMSQIDKALVVQDTSTLAKILHKDLSLGHSNGWIETKRDLLETLITDAITYLKIENAEPFSVHHTSENLTTTRRKIDVTGTLNDTPFEVKLNVLEVWIYQEKNWQLLARQSVNRKD